MRNSYETSEVVELGTSREVILGSKPVYPENDSIQGTNRQAIPEPDDIDETDE